MFPKKPIKRALRPLKRWLLREIQNEMAPIGRIASWHVRSQEVISSLQDVEFRVCSQWGEDGIIDWLIERAKIPPKLQTFVEFGVEDYREANTRFLLQNRNWRGLILDGSPAMLDLLEGDELGWRYDITAKPAFITRENINQLISDAGFDGEIGLLSIDLDGNDYWIWEVIEVASPIICICEYNAIFGDIHPISIPYDPTFHRTRAHYSNLYFGASIAALCSLAAKKGYRFVGTTSAANDAFFVREDYARRFVDTSLKQVRPMPSLARESKDVRGLHTYIGGTERIRQISSLPVVNVETGSVVTLDDLAPVYSKEWHEIIHTPGNR